MAAMDGPVAEPSATIAPPPASAPTSRIKVAQSILFQQQIDALLSAIGSSQAKDAPIRLAGTRYIDNVRRAAHLCVHLDIRCTSTHTCQTRQDVQYCLYVLS